MPYLVRERLFIGNIGDAADVLQGGGPAAGGITHVLSLLSTASISFFSEWRSDISIPVEEIQSVLVEANESPKRALVAGKLLYALERAGPELKILRMAIPLRDTEIENLLDYLEVCFDFIEQGRKEGSVLVHCFAGVSRSASVITSYLMKSEQKSLDDALESLKQVNEFVCPNDGFLDQLKIFEEMGFKVDTSSPIYKRFRLKILALSYKMGEKVDSSIFESDPGVVVPQGESNSKANDKDKDKDRERNTVYRCKKCRRVVALQENIVSHVAGEADTGTCFDWQRKKGGRQSSQLRFSRSDDQECSSLFIEPLKWMTPVEEGALEGKLSCINCEARLGYFNWSGIQCSCRSWITPAFQIHKSKVDKSTA